MKFISFFIAAGFLSTLSAAVPAPTTTFTRADASAPGTMPASKAAMPEPTLMPRYDADAICKVLRSGKYREWQVPDGETITIHMKRQARSLLPRMSPEDIESFCNDLKQGNVNEYTIPKHHKEPITITNIFGDE